MPQTGQSHLDWPNAGCQITAKQCPAHHNPRFYRKKPRFETILWPFSETAKNRTRTGSLKTTCHMRQSMSHAALR
jgi:hypothetical protein